MSASLQPQEPTDYSGWQSPFQAAARRLPRQPHAGSALLVLGLFAIVMLLAGTAVVLVGRKLHLLPAGAIAAYTNPRLSILIEFLAYAVTAVAAYPLLRTFWQRPIGAVLQMNWPAARRYALPLVGAGLVLAVLAQLAAAQMSLPKDMPIDKFFTGTLDVWLVALFGTLVAPVAEEVFFRGFLLPAFAIAFDWTRHFLGEPEEAFWLETSDTSRPGWIFGAVLSSVLFAAMHAAQLGWAWNAVAVLTVVGLALAAIRIRLQSVWASTLVHVGYNGLLFVVLFFATDGYRHLDKIKR